MATAPQGQLFPSAVTEETVYAVKGSDAEQHVTSKFPLKTVKPISNMFSALLRRKVKLKGSAKLMGAFAKCFPA